MLAETEAQMALEPSQDDTCDNELNDTESSKTRICCDCPTEDERLRYQSGKVRRCYICQGYKNMVTNSGSKGGKKAGIIRAITFSLEEFRVWANEHPRKCIYCNIDDALYHSLELAQANGNTLEALGIDRLENSGDYSLDNIAWCCYVCNRAKAGRFTHQQFLRIGVVMESVWREECATSLQEELELEIEKAQQTGREMLWQEPCVFAGLDE